MVWKRKREKVKQALHQQQEKNIKELKELGIHYVSSKQYYKNKDTFRYAIGIIPTYKPTILERLRISISFLKKREK